MLKIDLHTHTIASGHGTRDTVTDLAKAAAARGMTMLGITDHGPATPGGAAVSYFRSLPSGPRFRFGVDVRYGAEANILDGGALDPVVELPHTLERDLRHCQANPRTSLIV